MPRPKRKRQVKGLPLIEGFKPFGIPSTELEFINLLYDEYESVKLADYDGLTQHEASLIMGVSRPTFTRIYEKARKSIAKAMIEGKGLIISGGDVDFSEKIMTCKHCQKRYNKSDEINHVGRNCNKIN